MTATDINNALDRVINHDKQTYTAILNAIDAMNDDDNITVDALTTDIAPSLAMTDAQLRPLIQHFVRIAEPEGLCYLSHGRKGGVRKGKRPDKTTKTPRKPKIETVSIDDTVEIEDIEMDIIEQAMEAE